MIRVTLPEIFNKVLMEAAEKGATDVYIKQGSRPFISDFNCSGYLSVEVINQEDIKQLLGSLKSSFREHESPSKKSIRTIYTCLPKKRLPIRIEVLAEEEVFSLTIRLYLPEPLTFNEVFMPSSIKNIIDQNESGILLVSGEQRSGLTSTLASIIQHITNKGVKRIAYFSDESVAGLEEPVFHVIHLYPVSRVASFSRLLKQCQSMDVLIVDSKLTKKQILLLVQFSSANKCLVIYCANAMRAVDAINYCVLLHSIVKDKYNSVHDGRFLDMFSNVFLGVLWKEIGFDKHNKAFSIYETIVATPGIKSCIRGDKINQIYGMIDNSDLMVTRYQYLVLLVTDNVISLDEAKRLARYIPEFERVYDFMTRKK
jgi:Tfp pilus assembly pilus retraction ATPase PilT